MGRNDELEDLLHGMELFGGLSNRAIRGIADEMRSYDHPAGTPVLVQDDAATFGRMYLVLAGEAEARVDDVVVAHYGPGDHFGEMSLLDGGPRSATVTARTPLRTAALSAGSLRALLEDHPELSVRIIEVLASRLRATNLLLGD